MSQDKEAWSIEKVIACLKRIVHSDVLPSISQEELERFRYLKVNNGIIEVLVFLEFVYKKSDQKLRIYGSVSDMMENLRKIDKIPEFIVFSSDEGVKVSCDCVLLTPSFGYTESSGTTVYASRSNIATNTFKDMTVLVHSFGIHEISGLFFRTWQTAYFNQLSRRFKGSYDLILSSLRKPLIVELDALYQSKPNIIFPKGTITIQWFAKLKKYFEPEERPFLTKAINDLRTELIPGSQDYFKKSYADIVFLIENTKKIFDKHMHLFTPLKELKINEKPRIRKLSTAVYAFFLAHEVHFSIKLLMKSRKKQFLEDLIIVESEEEKENGIIYALQPSKFEEILKKFGLSEDDFVILDVPCDIDYRYHTLPIISSYRTHCMPAFDAFSSIIYYLAVVLKVFQKSNTKNLQEVFKWINDMMDSYFVKKPVFHLIEMEKIEEIIDKARKELSHFLTESEYEVPFKEIYDENDVFREFKKMTMNLEMDDLWFSASVQQSLNWMSKQPIHFKTMYFGYSQMIVYYLQQYYPKVESFIDNQWIHKKELKVFQNEKKSKSELEENIFSGFKKGFLNKSAESSKMSQELEQNVKIHDSEEVDGVQKSPENAEIQQLREELKKQEDYENRLQDKFKTEKSCLKNEAENSEAEVRRLRKELEKSQKKNSELESELKTDLKNVNENSESEVRRLREELEKSQKKNIELESELKTETEKSGKDIQKVRDELEKHQKSESQLEEKLKTQKQNHVEEVRILGEDLKRNAKDILLLRGDLAKEKNKNIDLVEKSGTLEKNCEDLKRKVKTLVAESEKKIELQLEEQLKTLKQNHQEEVRILSEDLKRNEKDILLLRGDLAREKNKNIDLAEKSETLEKDCEDLKRKVETSMSESGKNTEFQQKIKEYTKNLENQHCELVDSAWSRLHRLCSKYPESDDVKEAKDGVMRLEDCLDEYVEDVKKEYKKLRE